MKSAYLIFIICLVISLGCHRSNNLNDLTRSRNIKIIELYVDEIWNNWNFSIVDSIIGEELIDPASKTGEKGPEAFKEVLSTFKDIYPDISLAIDEIVADGDRVAWKWTAKATHSPTGKPVQFSGIIMDRIIDGKIIQRWGYYDQLGIQEQLSE